MNNIHRDVAAADAWVNPSGRSGQEASMGIVLAVLVFAALSLGFAC